MKNLELVKSLKETQKRVLNQIEKLNFQLEMSKGVLLSHNYIVEVGAYTIGSKFNPEINAKVLDYKMTDYDLATMWNENGVKEIKKHLLEMGENREIKVYFYKDFYRTKLEDLKNFLKSNSELIKTLSK